MRKFERIMAKTEHELFIEQFSRRSFKLETREGVIIRIESDDPDIQQEAIRLGLIGI